MITLPSGRSAPVVLTAAVALASAPRSGRGTRDAAWSRADAAHAQGGGELGPGGHRLPALERVEHTLELGARLHALDPRRRGGGGRLVLVTGTGYG